MGQIWNKLEGTTEDHFFLGHKRISPQITRFSSTRIDAKDKDGNVALFFCNEIQPFATKTTSYVVTNLDSILNGNPGGAGVPANLTFTLPDPSTLPGKKYILTKIDDSSYSVFIDGNGFLISGESILEIKKQWVSITVVSIGSAWLII